MKTSNGSVTQGSRKVAGSDLEAYADGMLSDDEAMRVALYCAAHPEAAEHVAATARLNRLLRALDDGTAADAMPETMLSAGRALACALKTAEEAGAERPEPDLDPAAKAELRDGGCSASAARIR